MGIGHPQLKNRPPPVTTTDNNLCRCDTRVTSSSTCCRRCLKRPRPFKTMNCRARDFHNVLSLTKENARLRALAVGLSNLVGDLPVREWEDAARSCRTK